MSDQLVERIRLHCLAKPGATEDLPFDEQTLTFKVGGKMFCIIDMFDFQGCGLKCDPERIPELRASFDGVTTGRYLNPKHWNLVMPVPLGDVPWNELTSLIDHSYDMVWKGLTQKVRLSIQSEVSPSA